MSDWSTPPGGAASAVNDNDVLIVKQSDGVSRSVTRKQLLEGAQLKWQGDYADTSTYKTNHTVRFNNGSVYYCTTPTNLGESPLTHPEKWQILSSKGDKGDKGDTGDTGDKGDKGDTGLTGNPYKTYATKVAATADLANIPADALIWVNADPTPANIGYYTKTAGVLVQSPYDRVANVETDVLRKNKADITLQLGYFEESIVGTTNADSVYISATSFFVRASTGDITAAWPAAIATYLGASIALATSPRGVTNCIVVPHSAYLVWDFNTSKLEILTDRTTMAANHLLLVSAVYGRVTRGAWLGLASAYRRRALAISAGSYFYTANGNTNLVVEESTATGAPYYLHIKFDDIRIGTGTGALTVQKTWAQIKADINDASVFVNSPAGVADCLRLSDQALVLDNVTYTAKIVAKDSYQVENHILLAVTAYGLLLDGYLAKQAVSFRHKSVKTLTDQLTRTAEMEFYLASGSTTVPTIEESTTGGLILYINHSDIRIVGRTFTLVQRTWAQIKADINDATRFVTSPGGVADCMKLQDEAFVWDYTAAKCAVVARTTYDHTKHYLIAMSQYGCLSDGGLFRWAASARLKMLSKNYAPLAHRTTMTNYFYTLSALTVAPTVEECQVWQGGAPYYLYLNHSDAKFRDLNGVLITRTWAQVKADINDPSMFFTSPKGVADCLRLADQAYVFDFAQMKFRVIGKDAVDYATQLPLLITAYGIVVGGIFASYIVPFRYRELNSRMTSAESRLNGLSSANGGAANTDGYDQGTRFAAHRGLNGSNVFAPENTLPAYRLAGEYGYWGAETDIQQTYDGYWVLMHDGTVDRTTNGTGAVSALTLGEIRALDASKLCPGYSDVSVPTLDEYLEVCARYKMVPVIELKSDPVGNGVTSLLQSIRRTTGVQGTVLISFSYAALQAVRAAEPSIPMWWLASTLTQADIDKALALGNCGVDIGTGNTAAIIQTALDAGLRVGVWTPSQSQVRGEIAKGCSRITTNEAMPVNFSGGKIESITRNAADFSNFTNLGGNPAAVNGVLTISANSAYIDLPAQQGDVFSVAFEGKTPAVNNLPLFGIQGLDAGHNVLYTYTSESFQTATMKPDGTAALVLHSNVSFVRIFFSKGAGGNLFIRNVRIVQRRV